MLICKQQPLRNEMRSGIDAGLAGSPYCPPIAAHTMIQHDAMHKKTCNPCDHYTPVHNLQLRQGVDSMQHVLQRVQHLAHPAALGQVLAHRLDDHVVGCPACCFSAVRWQCATLQEPGAATLVVEALNDVGLRGVVHM